MRLQGSAGPHADSIVALSPQQFHNRLVATLRAAMAARSREPLGLDDEGTRALLGLLQEVPACAPREPYPSDTPRMLGGGVRWMIDRRRAEAAAGSERLLADLLEFVLAFYPEAVSPAAL